MENKKHNCPKCEGYDACICPSLQSVIDSLLRKQELEKIKNT